MRKFYKNKQAKVAAVLSSMNLGVNFKVYAPYYYDEPFSFRVGIKTRKNKPLPTLPARIGVHDITYSYKREGERGWSKVP